MTALSPVGSLVALALAQALIWFCLSQVATYATLTRHALALPTQRSRSGRRS